MSSEPVALPDFPHARAWQVRYWSRDVHDAPHVVAGTVIVPVMRYVGLRPIVGYAASTRGLAEHCAPSRLLAEGTDGEAPLIAAYLDRGFAVAVSDYEGMGGVGGSPTFLTGPSEAYAVLDVVRAAQALPPARLSRHAPVAVTGYSQGGHAAGWAAQLASTYAPDLRLCAAAVGGPPSDYLIGRDASDGSLSSALLIVSAVGLDAAFPELDLASSLTDRGHEAVASVRRDSLVDVVIANAFLSFDDWLSDRAMHRADWVAVATAQNLGGLAPQVETLLYHSTADDVIPFECSARLVGLWERQGAPVTVLTVDDGSNHLETHVGAAPHALEWIAARLA